MSWFTDIQNKIVGSWYWKAHKSLKPNYNLPGGRGRWFDTLYGSAPEPIVQGEEILVPTFEIATNPTIQLSEVKARRFYIVDRAQINAQAAIQAEEDANIFNAINAAAQVQEQMQKTSWTSDRNAYPTLRTIKNA